jgi:hypothetical protein
MVVEITFDYMDFKLFNGFTTGFINLENTQKD